LSLKFGGLTQRRQGAILGGLEKILGDMWGRWLWIPIVMIALRKLDRIRKVRADQGKNMENLGRGVVKDSLRFRSLECFMRINFPIWKSAVLRNTTRPKRPTSLPKAHGPTTSHMNHR
jgi:hypothetical protein